MYDVCFRWSFLSPILSLMFEFIFAGIFYLDMMADWPEFGICCMVAMLYK